jgi:hypothetical protein
MQEALTRQEQEFFGQPQHRRIFRLCGADVSNAFAEAPPPVTPLYIEVDKQYADWWESKGQGKIPDGSVLIVKQALQGHPESARLWARLIDKILKE